MTIDELFALIEKETPNETVSYMIEEYISGDEWSVTVLPNFRDMKWYTLHPIYRGSVRPAFRSNAPDSLSAQGSFAAPKVRESLDLYTKLAAGIINPSTPTTFVFRHVENNKPVLFRIIDRHILEDDPEVLRALEESAVSEGEYLDTILRGYQ